MSTLKILLDKYRLPTRCIKSHRRVCLKKAMEFVATIDWMPEKFQYRNRRRTI